MAHFLGKICLHRPRNFEINEKLPLLIILIKQLMFFKRLQLIAIKSGIFKVDIKFSLIFTNFPNKIMSRFLHP